MGNNSTKSDKSATTKLAKEKIQQIGLLFNTNNCEKTEITQDRLKGIWHKYLSKGLLTAILGVIFANKTYIMFEDFIDFYWKACENTSESEAEIILELIKTIGNGCKRHEYHRSVVTEFIQSYFKICAINADSFYNHWVKFGSFTDDTSSLTDYLLEGLNDEEIDFETLNLWINGNSLFRIISHNVFKTLFNIVALEEEVTLFPEFVHKSGYASILRPSDVIMLRWNLGQKSTLKWRLLFCLDNDGQSWSTFLKAIIAQGPTLIVIQDTNKYVFGAFASQSWNVNPNFYGNEDSFLFTLQPKMNNFESSGYNKNYQYINTGQSTLPNGLGMGGVHNYWGLFLNASFGSGLVSESCTTFKNYKRLAYDKEFTIDKLQVWGVGVPDPTPEELGERTTSVLDKDPAAVAILELAGRTLHSTEIRKMKPVDEE
uniref:MTOR-associated protein MEAK7 n=1 Tax=Triatoma infestans TaxID=30076 RepID=A0A023FB64_TRIIF